MLRHALPQGHHIWDMLSLQHPPVAWNPITEGSFFGSVSPYATRLVHAHMQRVSCRKASKASKARPCKPRRHRQHQRSTRRCVQRCAASAATSSTAASSRRRQPCCASSWTAAPCRCTSGTRPSRHESPCRARPPPPQPPRHRSPATPCQSTVCAVPCASRSPPSRHHTIGCPRPPPPGQPHRAGRGCPPVSYIHAPTFDTLTLLSFTELLTLDAVTAHSTPTDTQTRTPSVTPSGTTLLRLAVAVRRRARTQSSKGAVHANPTHILPRELLQGLVPELAYSGSEYDSTWSWSSLQDGKSRPGIPGRALLPAPTLTPMLIHAAVFCCYSWNEGSVGPICGQCTVHAIHLSEADSVYPKAVSSVAYVTSTTRLLTTLCLCLWRHLQVVCRVQIQADFSGSLQQMARICTLVLLGTCAFPLARCGPVTLELSTP